MTHAEFEERWQRQGRYRMLGGARSVLKLDRRGATVLVPESALPAYIEGCPCPRCRDADSAHPEDLEAAAAVWDRLTA